MTYNKPPIKPTRGKPLAGETRGLGTNRFFNKEKSQKFLANGFKVVVCLVAATGAIYLVERGLAIEDEEYNQRMAPYIASFEESQALQEELNTMTYTESNELTPDEILKNQLIEQFIPLYPGDPDSAIAAAAEEFANLQADQRGTR